MTDLINGRTPEEIKRWLRWATYRCVQTEDRCATCEYRDDCGEYCGSNTYEEALAYIDQLEAAQPKWISVEERLPDRYTPVLGNIKKDGTETYVAHVVIMDGSWWAKDTGVYYDDVGGDVTHWMPLPEPPEVEE